MKLLSGQEIHAWYDIISRGQKAGYAKFIDVFSRNRLQTFMIMRYIGERRIEHINIAAVLSRHVRGWSLRRYQWNHRTRGFAWAEFHQGRMLLERKGERTSLRLSAEAMIRPLIRLLAQYPVRRWMREEPAFTLFETGSDKIIGPGSLIPLNEGARSRMFQGRRDYHLLLRDEIIETLTVEKGVLMKLVQEDGIELLMTSQEGAMSRLPLPLQGAAFSEDEPAPRSRAPFWRRLLIRRSPARG